MEIGQGVFELRGSENRGLPLTWLIALTTVQRYRADCDVRSSNAFGFKRPCQLHSFARSSAAEIPTVGVAAGRQIPFQFPRFVAKYAVQRNGSDAHGPHLAELGAFANSQAGTFFRHQGGFPAPEHKREQCWPIKVPWEATLSIEYARKHRRLEHSPADPVWSLYSAPQTPSCISAVTA